MRIKCLVDQESIKDCENKLFFYESMRKEFLYITRFNHIVSIFSERFTTILFFSTLKLKIEKKTPACWIQASRKIKKKKKSNRDEGSQHAVHGHQ